MCEDYVRRHINFCFVHLRPSHRAKLENAGILQIIGPNCIFTKCDTAVSFLQAQQMRDLGNYQPAPTTFQVIEQYREESPQVPSVAATESELETDLEEYS
jgi:hypothetical protein